MNKTATDARNTVAGTCGVLSVDETSVVQIGDCKRLAPVTRALAVQRERAVYRRGEFALRDFGLLRRFVPLPAITERVAMRRIQANPDIRLGALRVLALASTSIVQIGSGRELFAESRIKHIRHLFREAPAESGRGN